MTSDIVHNDVVSGVHDQFVIQKNNKRVDHVVIIHFAASIALEKKDSLFIEILHVICCVRNKVEAKLFNTKRINGSK